MRVAGVAMATGTQAVVSLVGVCVCVCLRAPVCGCRRVSVGGRCRKRVGEEKNAKALYVHITTESRQMAWGF